METRRLTATRGERRLDRFLAAEFADLSRSRLQALIRDGHVLLDGAPATATTEVRPGAEIAVTIPDEAIPEALPEAIPLTVLYEDRDVLVVDKPAGMVVHPAPGHDSGTLVNAALGYTGALAPDEPNRPGIVHRLDRDTSGVMILARTRHAHDVLAAQFEDRSVDKRYIALVDGLPSSPKASIDAPLGRDPRNRQRMGIVARGRPAVTDYTVTTAYRDPWRALLEVHPHTGRTHQIRVHLASIGHPVTGDAVYGRGGEPGRQFLHAASLTVTLPDGTRHTFEAPLPPDLADFLASLTPAE